MAGSKLTPAQQEAQWRAQDDARTLAQAETIKKDKKRLNAATKEAQRMANEQAKAASELAAIAKTKPKKK